MYIIISKRWKWESFKPFFHHIPEVYMTVFTNSMYIFRECPGCYTGFLWDYRWLCSAFDQSFDYRSVQKGKSVETASLPRYSVSPWANNFRKERWAEGPTAAIISSFPSPWPTPIKGHSQLFPWGRLLNFPQERGCPWLCMLINTIPSIEGLFYLLALHCLRILNL